MIWHAAIVRSTNQPIGGMVQMLCTLHQGHQICLAVGHTHQTRAGHLGPHFGDAVMAFHPTQTLLRTIALPVFFASRVPTYKHQLRPVGCVRALRRRSDADTCQEYSPSDPPQTAPSGASLAC